MGNKSTIPPQRDITKAVKAAMGAGMLVARVEIGPDGTIVLVSREEVQSQPVTALNQWRASRAAR